MSNHLRGIIDRIEGDFAVIELAGGQEIYWPKINIDLAIKEGEPVNLYLTREEVQPENSEDTQKNLLRQIFQPNV